MKRLGRLRAGNSLTAHYWQVPGNQLESDSAVDSDESIEMIVADPGP